MNPSRSFLAACSLVLLAVASLNCGDDDDDATTTSTTTTSSGTTTVTTGTGGTDATTSGTAGGDGGSGGGGGIGGDGGGGTGGGLGGGGMGGGGGAPPTISLDVGVVDAFTQLGLPGLSVCVLNQPSTCQTTDANGEATLTVPDVDLTLEWSGGDYRQHVIRIRGGLPSTGVSVSSLSNTNLANLLGLLGLSDDPTKGHIAGGVDAVGATAAVFPASGDGVVYAGTNGFPDPTLTGTSAAGTFLFTNVDAGLTTEVEVLASGLMCTPLVGPAGTASNRTLGPVLPGAITILSFFNCQ